MRPITNSSLRIIYPGYDVNRLDEKLISVCPTIEFILMKYFKTNIPEYIEYLIHKRFTLNWSIKMIENFLRSPLNLVAVIIETGDADMMITDQKIDINTILRTAIRIFDIQKKNNFIFCSSYLTFQDNCNYFCYADCQIVPEPSVDQLVKIAAVSATHYRNLLNNDPRIAFISFSTKGSREHYRIEKVVGALNKFKTGYPEYQSDGEFMFDDAIGSFYSWKKDMNSESTVTPNIFVFPNLDAGNMALKITQILGGIHHVGSFVHGLNYPLWILDKSVDDEDIFRLLTLLENWKN